MGPTFHTLAGALRWALGRISPDSRGDYWQYAEGILNAADMSHQPVAWQERQQRSATEWGPWYHCTRMRRPDEPLAATLGGIGHQWRPVFAHEEPAAMGTAAVRTLERMGYKWRGGELWAPPIGSAPDWATHPSPSAAEQAGRWAPIKVAYSGGHKMVGPGARWRDRLTGSEWDVVEPGDGVVYSPSGLGGTLCFWCRPVGEVPDTAKRWLDTARADGCVSFCGDSIAAGMLPAAPSASPAEVPAGPTDEDRRTALVKIGQAAIAVGWRDDFVRDRLLAAHPQPVAPAWQAWGWAIVDKNGDEVDTRARFTAFFGAVNHEEEPFDAEWLSSRDREFPGLAPHRVVTLYTSPQPAGQAAAGVQGVDSCLMTVVEHILDEGHLSTEGLGRLRHAWENAAPAVERGLSDPDRQLIEGVLRGAVGSYAMIGTPALSKQAQEALDAFRAAIAASAPTAGKEQA